MKISFVIPVFNSGDLLVEAVDSIRRNNYLGHEFEIIVVNDCSSDPVTIALLVDLAKQENIVLVQQSSNGGPARARNAGIVASSGSWISFLDADDYLAPDAMETRLRLIAENPDCRWLAGDNIDVVASTKQCQHPDLFEKLLEEPELADGNRILRQATKKLLYIGAAPLMGTMMIRRDILLKSGMFDVSLTYGEDTNLFLVLSLDNDLYWIPKPLLYYRKHENSMTKNLLRIARELHRSSRALLFDRRFLDLNRELRWRHADILRRSASIYVRIPGRIHLAFLMVFESLFWSVNDSKNWRVLKKCIVALFPF